MSPPGARSRLAVCPSCSSKLIYPIDLAGWHWDSVVSRRCPDCEHRDIVVTSRLAAALWFARNARQRTELAALCDAIADGLPLESGLVSETKPPSPPQRQRR